MTQGPINFHEYTWEYNPNHEVLNIYHLPCKSVWYLSGLTTAPLQDVISSTYNHGCECPETGKHAAPMNQPWKLIDCPTINPELKYWAPVTNPPEN